jgi:hypothetical protein
VDCAPGENIVTVCDKIGVNKVTEEETGLTRNNNSGLIGAALIGVGCGLTAIGIAMVVPAAAGWSLSFAETAIKRGREGMGSAAGFIGEVAGTAKHHFGEATKQAKVHTAKAASAVETAARSVREYAS